MQSIKSQQARSSSTRCPRQQRRYRGVTVKVQAKGQQQQATLATVPLDYTQAVRQAQAALKAALADGVQLLEASPCVPWATPSVLSLHRHHLNPCMSHDQSMSDGRWQRQRLNSTHANSSMACRAHAR